MLYANITALSCRVVDIIQCSMTFVYPLTCQVTRLAKLRMESAGGFD